ncbi:MAG TPA: hypothetical protein VHX86_00740 [Tepidisphaeraceae bacterium]|nr:hypothetical protein [Tepidisphaeraceae bacterium]
MPDIRPILEYPTPQPLDKLTLEEGADFARVVFPVSPMWVYWLLVGGSVAIALMATIGSLVIGVMILRPYAAVGLYPATKAKLWHLSFIPLSENLGMPLFWWCLAIFEWWKYRRWGRVPRVLLARVDG